MSTDTLNRCIDDALQFGFVQVKVDDKYRILAYDEPAMGCIVHLDTKHNIWDVCAYEKRNQKDYDCVLVAKPTGIDIPQFVKQFKSKLGIYAN